MGSVTPERWTRTSTLGPMRSKAAVSAAALRAAKSTKHERAPLAARQMNCLNEGPKKRTAVLSGGRREAAVLRAAKSDSAGAVAATLSTRNSCPNILADWQPQIPLRIAIADVFHKANE